MPDCTLTPGGAPLRCHCDDSWKRWFCQDYRCLEKTECPGPEENVICSDGSFEPTECRCVQPEKKWACYWNGDPFYCMPFPGASEGSPCYCGQSHGITFPYMGRQCTCLNEHWRCAVVDGG